MTTSERPNGRNVYAFADWRFRGSEIYNHYIKYSAVAMELDPLTDEDWIGRMEDCRADRFDMFVAVQKTANGHGQNRRGHAKEELVFGVTYAEATYGKRNSGRFTATVQVYVNWRHPRLGVGRCLMDRVMTMLNFNHDCKPGVEYSGEKPLMQREVKKVVIGKPLIVPQERCSPWCGINVLTAVYRGAVLGGS